MAIDTQNRRASCLGLALPFRAVWPNPDGSLASAADRQHIAYTYPGIATAEPATVSPGDVFRESARGIIFRDARAVTFNSRRGCMPMITRVKRPGETRTYVYDYSDFPEIVDGDTLSGTPTVNIVTGDDELTAGSPARSGDTVEVTYSAGTSGVEYLTESLCNTNSGAILSCVGKVKVTRFGDK